MSSPLVLDSSFSGSSFEDSAAVRINAMLDNIDSLLFDGVALDWVSPPTAVNRYYRHHLISDYWQECENWRAKFLHLRVKGKQITGTKETEIVAASAAGATAPPEVDLDTRLEICGHALQGCERLDEEIISFDGKVEDLIALDASSLSSSAEYYPGLTALGDLRSSLRLLSIGAPPLTPIKAQRWEMIQSSLEPGDEAFGLCQPLMDEAVRVLLQISQSSPDSAIAALDRFLSVASAGSISDSISGPSSDWVFEVSDSEELSRSNLLELDDGALDDSASLSIDADQSRSDRSLFDSDSPLASHRDRTQQLIASSSPREQFSSSSSISSVSPLLAISGSSAVLHPEKSVPYRSLPHNYSTSPRSNPVRAPSLPPSTLSSISRPPVTQPPTLFITPLRPYKTSSSTSGTLPSRSAPRLLFQPAPRSFGRLPLSSLALRPVSPIGGSSAPAHSQSHSQPHSLLPSLFVSDSRSSISSQRPKTQSTFDLHRSSSRRPMPQPSLLNQQLRVNTAIPAANRASQPQPPSLSALLSTHKISDGSAAHPHRSPPQLRASASASSLPRSSAHDTSSLSQRPKHSAKVAPIRLTDAQQRPGPNRLPPIK